MVDRAIKRLPGLTDDVFVGRDGALGCVSLAYDEPTATFDDAGDLV